MRRTNRILPLSLALLAASCQAPQKPSPVPPPPKPAAPAAPRVADWRDLPLTRGNWRFVAAPGTSTARFEAIDGGLVFSLRCDKATRQVALIRANAPASTSLKVTTSYGERLLGMTTLAATDPLLDQIAFSRGHFTIEAAGLPELVLPAWAEPGRVIEECRG